MNKQVRDILLSYFPLEQVHQIKNLFILRFHLTDGGIYDLQLAIEDMDLLIDPSIEIRKAYKTAGMYGRIIPSKTELIPIKDVKGETSKVKIRGKNLSVAQRKVITRTKELSDAQIDNYLLQKIKQVESGKRKLSRDGDKNDVYILIHRKTGEIKEVVV